MNQLTTTTNQTQNELTMWTEEQWKIFQNTYAKDLTRDEIEVFKYVCVHTRLNPILKQIYPIKRKGVLCPQTSIDGYRLIAERTKRYCPGPKPTFEFDEKGKLVSATSYVKKQTEDGTWHIVEAIAFYDEYAQKAGDGRITNMWVNMGKSQLAKCAESLALRKAFPWEFASVRTEEEMQQADVEVLNAPPTPPPVEKKVISSEQLLQIDEMLKKCPGDFIVNVTGYVTKNFGSFEKIDEKSFAPIISRIQSKLEEMEKATLEVVNAA